MKRKDLHKIAPRLSEISLDKIGFEIPENYFDTVEDDVMASLKTETLQHKVNSKTFKTPQNYFNTIEDIVVAKLKAEVIQNTHKTSLPKNYFESIEENVFSKIKTSSKVISLKRSVVKFIAPIAIAASLLLIFTLNNNSTTVTFDSLASTEIETWIDNGSIDFDALSLASVYPEIELDINLYSDALSDDEVLEYLNFEYLDEIIYEN